MKLFDTRLFGSEKQEEIEKQPLQQQQEEEPIHIKLCLNVYRGTQLEKRVDVLLPPEKSLKAIEDLCARRYYGDRAAAFLLYKGIRIDVNATPESMGLNNGDVIDCYSCSTVAYSTMQAEYTLHLCVGMNSTRLLTARNLHDTEDGYILSRYYSYSDRTVEDIIDPSSTPECCMQYIPKGRVQALPLDKLTMKMKDFSDVQRIHIHTVLKMYPPGVIVTSSKQPAEAINEERINGVIECTTTAQQQ